MGIWLSEKELRSLEPAETVLRSPIPTQVVSNGEYTPSQQTPAQRRVERRIRELGSQYGAELGLSRRDFLRTTCGMAAAFVAMNDVYGPFFAVDSAEAREVEAAEERRRALSRQFIFDAQLHFVRDDFRAEALLQLGEFAKRWNPKLEKEGVTLDRYKFENFLKEVFLDSETDAGLLSGAPSDDPDLWLLTNDQLAEARSIVNEIAGSRRMLCHAVITPGKPGWLEEVDRAIEELQPDGWKGYTVGDPLNPSEWAWRLDDEKLMYPAYEKMEKAGIRNVCVHKGLIPGDDLENFQNREYAKVDDLGKAARDWPNLNFIIYHSAFRPWLSPVDDVLREYERTGRIDWVTDLAEIPEEYGVSNVYAELGTTFGSCGVTHPKLAAGVLGTLIRGMGADHVIWGTDSVWYGSPQWQIEAFRRIEIPEKMQREHGYPSLGGADGLTKNAILGHNAARLYGVEVKTGDARNDEFARLKRHYLAEGNLRSNTFYGFVRSRAGRRGGNAKRV